MTTTCPCPRPAGLNDEEARAQIDHATGGAVSRGRPVPAVPGYRLSRLTWVAGIWMEWHVVEWRRCRVNFPHHAPLTDDYRCILREGHEGMHRDAASDWSCDDGPLETVTDPAPWPIPCWVLAAANPAAEAERWRPGGGQAAVTTTPQPCDPAVFHGGTLVFTTHTIPSAQMENWVRRVADRSGQPVDWHFAGGRARVLALGDLARVRVALEALKHDHDLLFAAAYRETLGEDPPPDHIPALPPPAQGFARPAEVEGQGERPCNAPPSISCPFVPGGRHGRCVLSWHHTGAHRDRGDRIWPSSWMTDEERAWHGWPPRSQPPAPPPPAPHRWEVGQWARVGRQAVGRIIRPDSPNLATCLRPARVMDIMPGTPTREEVIDLEHDDGLRRAWYVSLCTPVPPPGREGGEVPAGTRIGFYGERPGSQALAANRQHVDNCKAAAGALSVAVHALATWAPPTPADHAAEALAALRQWATAPVRWWRERQERRARLHAGAVNRALVSGSLGVATSGLPVEED